MKIETSIDINATPSKVWAVTLDVEALPEHTSTMTSVERLDAGPLAVGSRVRIKQPVQPSRVWTVTTFEPDQQFVWSTRLMGMTMTGWHVMSPIPTGTRNTLAIELDGALAPILGTLLRSSVKKSLIIENEGIRDAATTESA